MRTSEVAADASGPQDKRPSRRHRRTKRVAVAFGGIIASAAVIGATTQAVLERRALHRYPVPGRLVEVRGHRMHLWCTGHGAPAVVLVSGLGGWSLDWGLVQPGVARTTQVCSYDRPGFGWSEPHASTLTPEGIVADLHELLERADVRGPYVLVGQSVGGIYSRLYAERYPSEVAAMVFVDSSHEEQFSRYPKVRRDTEAQLRLLRFARYLAPFGVGRLIDQPVAEKNLPGELGAMARGVGSRTSAYFAFYDEATRLLDAARTLKLPTTPFRIPIIVLTSGVHIQHKADGSQWSALQGELREISPCGSQTIVPNAGHEIQVDAPTAVVAAIIKAVEASSGPC